MTYHSKEVLDAAGVDGVQRGDLDAQQRVFGSERHDGGSGSLVVCRVWRERLVLVYADRRCVGWYAGGLVLLWLRYGRMEVAEVSVTSARAWVDIGIGVGDYTFGNEERLEGCRSESKIPSQIMTIAFDVT